MKKIAIVCGAPSTEFLAPFEDKDWEIWVLANRIDRFKDKRVTKIFEIHDDLSEHGDINKYCEYVVSKNIPMVVGKGFPIKSDNIEVFPFEKAKELYGSNYLTSSTSYMMAYAILNGATHISIYGSDMSVDDHEYFWQRPCLEAWIGFAKGKGIEVYIPEQSPLGKCDYIEGLGCGGKPDFSLPPFTQKEFISIADMHINKIDIMQKQIKELELTILAHDTARQVYERLAKVARAVEAGQTIKDLKSTISMK